MPEAAEKVIEMAAQTGLDSDCGLRIGVDHQPEGGFKYVIALEARSDRDTDYWFTSNGVLVVIDYDDARYLRGTVIRYQDDDAGQGFQFDNPNVERTIQ